MEELKTAKAHKVLLANRKMSEEIQKIIIDNLRTR